LVGIKKLLLHVAIGAQNFFRYVAIFERSVGMITADEQQQKSDFDSVISNFHFVFARDFQDTGDIVVINDSPPSVEFFPFESDVTMVPVHRKGSYIFVIPRRDNKNHHKNFKNQANT
jgi:hypothetical protein